MTYLETMIRNSGAPVRDQVQYQASTSVLNRNLFLTDDQFYNIVRDRIHHQIWVQIYFQIRQQS